jgi:hypothetical protein|tara:strand:- start:34 stop:228 length:195 start_codon:yes stop_codon:yes gene_type:complete
MIEKVIGRLFGSQRLSYRRLLAWLASCGFFAAGLLDGDGWVAITITYVGTDAAARALGAWRSGG